MTPNVHSFLQAVLGDEAAGALKKAGDRSETLSTAIGARAIVGWLDLVSRYGYEGEVPGFSGSYFRMVKSDDLFDVSVRMGKDSYEADKVDLPHVAAGLSVALGADYVPAEDLKDTDLVKMGANIDLLLMTQLVKAQQEEESATCQQCDEGHHERCRDEWCSCSCKKEEKSLEKGGTTAPGAPAKGAGPAGPVGGGFTTPTASAPKRQRKKGFGAKLTASQATSKCSVCGEAQFKGDRFLGCFCLRDLAKHATVDRADKDGYHLTFDPEFWGQSDVTLFMDIVGEVGNGR